MVELWSSKPANNNKTWKCGSGIIGTHLEHLSKVDYRSLSVRIFIDSVIEAALANLALHLAQASDVLHYIRLTVDQALHDLIELLHLHKKNC
jgi:hypothetical protein